MPQCDRNKRRLTNKQLWIWSTSIKRIQDNHLIINWKGRKESTFHGEKNGKRIWKDQPVNWRTCSATQLKISSIDACAAPSRASMAPRPVPPPSSGCALCFLAGRFGRVPQKNEIWEEAPVCVIRYIDQGCMRLPPHPLLFFWGVPHPLQEFWIVLGQAEYGKENQPIRTCLEREPGRETNWSRWAG